MNIRVRFAPSPTGYLHVGGARTALFNWLFARGHKGSLLLRIEDTDVERSQQGMTQGILEGLEWLGIDWDEGPIFQSHRLDFYRERAQQLLDRGFVYRCFCTPEQIESRRNEAQRFGQGWSYDRSCRPLDPRETAQRAELEPCVLRFRVPDGRLIQFEDRVFGPIAVDSTTIEDFVLLRSDGMPTYHLGVVADDIDMRITHVIRGADHLSNTPKHLLLFEAFGQNLPIFVHLPLILGPDRKRLSKRHGATAVGEFRRQGFLPQALRNFLALLGWSPGDDQELFTDDELIGRFSLERINKADAIFDVQKLEWMNAQYLARLPAEQLVEPVREILEAGSLWNPEWELDKKGDLVRRLSLLKIRVRRLSELLEDWRAFFSDDFYDDPEAVNKFLNPDGERTTIIRTALAELASEYESLSCFDLESTETVLRNIAWKHGLKAGELIGAVRVALTGRAQAPGIFDVIVSLGKSTTLRRLRRVEQML